MTKLQVYRDKAGQWRWRRVASNGKITACSGESFTRKHGAIRAIVGDVMGVCLVCKRYHHLRAGVTKSVEVLDS